MRILSVSSSSCARTSRNLLLPKNNATTTTRVVGGKRSSMTVAAASRFTTAAPRFWKSPFQWYSHRLDTHPILTKCVSAGLIATTGNLLAQTITHKQKQKPGKKEEDLVIDWGAVGRFAFLNVTYVAPVLHYWYQWVNRVFPGTTLKAVLTRVVWDEFIFTPFYLPVFMGGVWAMEGTSPGRIQQMLWNEMPSIIVAEWTVWVPTMFMTFRYVPVKYQVLAINVVCIGWQTFLSLMADQAHHKTTTHDIQKEKQHQPHKKKHTTTPAALEHLKPINLAQKVPGMVPPPKITACEPILSTTPVVDRR